MKTLFTYQKVSFRKLFLLTGLMLWLTSSAFAQTKHTIEVSNTIFSPDVLEITTGDTVEWVNGEGIHNVNGSQGTFPDNPESFGNSTGSGWTYSYVFNTPGTYDYRCDPHYTLGMTGKIEVAGNDDDKGNLIVNLSGMDPHVGQTLWLSVQDKDTGEEIERKQEDVSVEFSVNISGIEAGHSYFVKFFADHNANGSYDAPPADHAWMLELDNATGDDTLNFAHNTNFTDIMWKHSLTVQFSDMTPHIGQMLKIYIVNTTDGMIKDSITVNQVSEADFDIKSNSLLKGNSYNIDFFADLNLNGSYDIPPLDHAWRITLDNVEGDTTLYFSHNLDFTDIFNLTSISDSELKQARMYPNPATDKVTIETGSANTSNFSLKVYDITGKIIVVQKTDMNKKVELDVQDLTQGIYFVELQTPNYQKVMKLTKE